MDKEKILHLLGGILEKSPDALAEMPAGQKLADIGIDSIRFIRFIVALEEEFNIEILDSDLLMSKFETFELLFFTLEKYFRPPEPLKKVLVCDCDNVLWHGISGEEEIELDEKITAFQNALIRLYDQGVLICLCSRNEKANVEEAFSILEMPLKHEQILISKIDMNDKASNIRAISEELNLSLDSFVFVDDSDYELGLVNSLLPEVRTVKADYDGLAFVERVQSYFTHEANSDTDRTRQYREQKEREKEKRRFATVDEYNASLQTEADFSAATHDQAGRIAELSQRTNQFNLSGRRYTTDEVYALISNETCLVMSLSASDRYGDMGIVGAAAVRATDRETIIESFFLSCRAFGRGFEDVMIGRIKKLFPDKEVLGVYVRTEKNKRHSGFYAEHGVKLHE